MSTRRADLAGVVPLPAAFPVQHLARILRALHVSLHDRMPAATVWAADLRSKLKPRPFHPLTLTPAP